MPTAPFLAPERDDLQRTGRSKSGGGTVYYAIPGCVFVSVGVSAPVANTDYYMPFFVATPLVIDQAATEVQTSAAGNLRIGAYAATADWQPRGDPLFDSGSLDTSTTGVKTYAPSTPLYLPRGRYLSIMNTDTGAIQLRAFRGSFGYQPVGTTMGASPFVAGMTVGRSYAAFPTPGTAWTAVDLGTTAILHYVLYRVLAS